MVRHCCVNPSLSTDTHNTQIAHGCSSVPLGCYTHTVHRPCCRRIGYGLPRLNAKDVERVRAEDVCELWLFCQSTVREQPAVENQFGGNDDNDDDDPQRAMMEMFSRDSKRCSGVRFVTHFAHRSQKVCNRSRSVGRFVESE